MHSPFLTSRPYFSRWPPPLPSYVKARSHKHLVAEGAIFHWWGDTSSGKTLLSQTTASVFGAPHLSQSFDITARAISEVAARSNDLVVIVDDSEVTDTDAECHKMMALLGRVLPRGYSKAISRVPGKTYPPLTWSCLGVTSGPISSAELARRLGRPRFGQAVRFFDIPVPQSGKGGIFSSKQKGTKEDHVDPSALLDTLTHAISSNFGVLFPAWIDLLLSEELADRTEKLVSRFVRKVGAHAGAEERAARKFGLLYAAGVLGVSLGLLPWPKSWPFEAVAYLYQRSRHASDPDSALIDKAIEKLCKKLNDPSCFPPKRSLGPTRFSQDTIGLRNREGRIWLCKSRLTALGLHSQTLAAGVDKQARYTGCRRAWNSAPKCSASR